MKANTPFRVVRGGSFNFDSDFVRAAVRLGGLPGAAYPNFGFRVVRTVSRVVRGGSWDLDLAQAFCGACRFTFDPDKCGVCFGFRVARTASPPSRVVRGGSCLNDDKSVFHSNCRRYYTPGLRLVCCGFRCARSRP